MEFGHALLDCIARAQRIAVLTGAGVSAESGVPTFRDAQTGLWSKFRPEDLATPEAFRRNPKLVWQWYESRRIALRGVAPNAGHVALVEMERRAPHFTLITQNVDGLHARAGSQNVLELHGNIGRTKCFAEGVVVDSWPATDAEPPPCPRCNAPLRPDVVWFGEALPEDALRAANQSALECDVFFTIGTSALVHPAAALPDIALEAGAVVVEINPDPTPFTPRATHVLRGTSGAVLPALVASVWGD